MASGTSLPATLGELVTVVGSDGSTARVSLQGGHVVSWQTADGRERFFDTAYSPTPLVAPWNNGSGFGAMGCGGRCPAHTIREPA